MRRSIGALAAAVCTASAAAQPGFTERPEVQAFIAEMTARHGFISKELEQLFERARFDPDVIRLITPKPQGERSWQAYRANFLNDRRIQAGTRFWSRNAKKLAQAESRFGVPADVIVAIIGIETEFGRNTGTFRVVDSLTTLAFDYPMRADFFRSQLEEFLLFAREDGRNVFGLKGSYAGAMGIPQFMPGSYRRFAVDFDGDGSRDLLGSEADAIGSVANFLKEHGWARGEPIAFPASVEGDAYRAFVNSGVKPRYRADALRDAGVTFSSEPAPDTQCVLVELESPDAASEHWVGVHNFYVLTRYNRSTFYAIAVLELAGEIRAARGKR
ncbi:MAG: lytic murein transglycosylase B [Betaproteobacteria bacterium]|nr:lytic murein transglycosylase B [Betaproteobacteria bacterium]